MKLSRSYIALIFWLWPMVYLLAQNLPFAQSGTFQLADPILQYDSVMFQESATVTIAFDLENVSIFYTLNGNDPTMGSTIYQHPIVISESAKIKARAFHPDCRASAVVSQEFLRVGKALSISDIQLKHQPSKQYSGKGKKSLFDLQKGSENFQDGQWLGFDGNNLEVEVQLNQPKTISTLIVSSLDNKSAWIFPIKKLEIYHSNDGENYESVASKAYENDSNTLSVGQQFLQLEFAPIETQFIKIIVHNHGKIPSWHPGAGSPAWLFVDELILK